MFVTLEAKELCKHQTDYRAFAHGGKDSRSFAHVTYVQPQRMGYIAASALRFEEHHGILLPPLSLASYLGQQFTQKQLKVFNHFLFFTFWSLENIRYIQLEAARLSTATQPLSQSNATWFAHEGRC